ncbi:aspartate-semialdehyde dehydrogenase [Halorhabdus sp. CUG00001]|uniref:aspartate-semialdehyde dehydrogenase n=1 Tax=Halorhabdus sp. CUG00001 TaxID=2600297 RepID=UPI00131BCBBA|nr:aspartate-semialdehyde dehydrogenase [Halorhabdus sp. CUG00001]
MPVDVGILGATGAVGQRLVQLLDPHPDFEIGALTASEDSAGKSYRETAKWRIDAPIPDHVAEMTVGATEPDAVPEGVDLLFSSLPSAVGEDVEPGFAEAGYVVSSNSSNFRTDPDVPLTIPEVNPEHVDLIEVQREQRGWDGALLKNPNCSTITMVPPLAALEEAFGVERVDVSTLQAVSGAGYSGVTSMEIIDNAIPHIGGEEDKMETESRKLLGTFDGSEVEWLEADVAASCNRIPTLDGHLENVWADLSADVTVEEVAEAMAEYPSAELHSSPDPLINVFAEPDRPQPRLDRNREDGMQISVGGIQATEAGVQFNTLAHNTLRGAAGASILNGELLAEKGYV